MNKTTLIAAIVALGSLSIAPAAMAQTNAGFTGVRGEAQVALLDVSKRANADDFTVNGVIGVDAPLGDRFTVGIEGTVDNALNKAELGAGARIGYAVNDKYLIFGRAGYARLEDARKHKLDGAAYGAGVEYRISERSFVSAQYRYTDYEQGVGSHGALIGVGIRF